MTPASAEHLVRVALEVVLGERADEVRVRVAADEAALATADDPHLAGLWLGLEEGDETADERLRRWIDSLEDAFAESRMLWGRRLPECPLHPDRHALLVDVREPEVVLRCPVAAAVVRRVGR